MINFLTHVTLNKDNYSLDVNGNARIGYPTTTIGSGFNSNLTIAAGSNSSQSVLYLATPDNNNGARKASIIAQGLGSYSTSKLMFCLENTTGNLLTDSAGSSDARMTILNNGYVGIGNTNPQTKLPFQKLWVTTLLDNSFMTFFDNTTPNYWDWAIGPTIRPVQVFPLAIWQHSAFVVVIAVLIIYMI